VSIPNLVQERDDLGIHVDQCTARYGEIWGKLNGIETQLEGNRRLMMATLAVSMMAFGEQLLPKIKTLLPLL
jgi:hypothetical protein